eukprot:CAMPEP_0182518042 /NCGR_PEP_ID=MMETSP1321-20130603/43441_1 /TAXON_ID=91990 /ORGANISM="Bolidomonas sp., Strain RCC1657" /LENGTH=368 /DNA_ID=CAMNT_0024725867 /DNA_START=48 /DNA_END=1151 /DNA_ORIENTATION=+
MGMCSPPSAWGGVLRPQFTVDDERRPKRAMIFFVSLIVVFLGVAASGVYFWHNLGTKTTTKKDVGTEPLARKLWDLSHNDDSGVQNLKCPCAKQQKLRLPVLRDLSTALELAPDSDTAEDCVETTALFKRCRDNIPAAKAAYDAMDVSTRDTCSAVDSTNTLALNACKRFVNTFRTKYMSYSYKINNLQDPYDFMEETMEYYIDMCESTIYSQTAEFSSLYDSLEVMGIDEANKDSYSKAALEDYVDPMEADGVSKICPWADDEIGNACEGKTCESYGGWPLFTDAEVTQVKAEYTAHFDECKAAQCSYIEDEDVTDVGMKVMALSSPIFSVVMTMAVIFYGCVDNHWEEREHELVGVAVHKSPMSGN